MTSPLDFYPWAETGARFELDLDGDGAFAEDVTPYVLGSGGDGGGVFTTAERGQQGEGAAAPPAAMTLRLDNADKRFSPRNPLGAYFGRIGRNTPVRCWLPAISSRLEVPAGVVDAASVPHASAPDATTDLDVRVWLEMPDWQGGGREVGLIHRWVTTAGDHHGWALDITATGQLVAYIDLTGGFGTTKTATSTAAVPRGPVRQALRVSVDWNNGAGGSDWKFWTAPDLAGPWTQLGDTVTLAGTLAPVAAVAPLAVGDLDVFGGRAPMTILGAQLWNGREEAGGTLLVDLDLTDEPDGATSVTSSTGHVWTVAAGLAVSRRDYLFTGTVPDWQTAPGLVVDDCEVTATASDDLRRVGNKAARIGGAYKRGATSPDAPMQALVGYWPMEDTAGASSWSSALPGGSPMTILGDPSLAADSDAFACSDPLPTLTASAGGSANLPTAPSGAVQVQVLLKLPAGGVAADRVILDVACTGSANRWKLSVEPTGFLYLDVYNNDGASIYSSPVWVLGPGSGSLNGVPVRLYVALYQAGGDVSVVVAALAVGETSGSFDTALLASRTIGRATRVRLAPSGGLTDAVAGHLTVQSALTDVFELSDQLNAYAGETAPQRIARLCAEQHVTADVVGYGGLSLGPQRPGTFVDLLREAELSDGGILHSAPDDLGFAYRSLTSMYSREPVLTGPWNGLGIVPGAAPIDDDRYAANDVTLSRPEGESFRAVQESGPANVQDPPLGIGRYERDGDVVSTATVDGLQQRTGWELHMGTVDEPRLADLTIDLGGAAYVAGTPASLALAEAVRRLDVGDRIRITDMPSWWGADTADLLVIGVKTAVGPWTLKRTFAVRPARAYRAARWNTTRDRYSVRGTVTAEALDATETGVDITPPSGHGWGHGSGDYDIAIGGEVMTVKAVTAPGASQTMTVVRSVNGVVKAHDAGAEVALADPCYYGLV